MTSSLHVATPMLTNQIKRLEESLGKKLLQRTTRHVALTEAGEIYRARAEKILAEIQGAKDEICQLEAKPHGQLTIGVPGSFNSRFFVKHMQQFLEKYPKMQLKVVEENSPSALLNEAVDLLISEMDVRDKQFIKEHLFTVHRSVYAAPKYLKKYGVPKTLADLKNHNCLIASRISPHDQWLLGGDKKVTVSGNYASSSGINILYAGFEGLGLIWCADIVLQEEVQKGQLVEIKLKDKPTPIKIYLYHRPVHRGSNIQLMADHLKKLTLSPSLVTRT